VVNTGDISLNPRITSGSSLATVSQSMILMENLKVTNMILSAKKIINTYDVDVEAKYILSRLIINQWILKFRCSLFNKKNKLKLYMLGAVPYIGSITCHNYINKFFFGKAYQDGLRIVGIEALISMSSNYL